MSAFAASGRWAVRIRAGRTIQSTSRSYAPRSVRLVSITVVRCAGHSVTTRCLSASSRSAFPAYAATLLPCKRPDRQLRIDLAVRTFKRSSFVGFLLRPRAQAGCEFGFRSPQLPLTRCLGKRTVSIQRESAPARICAETGGGPMRGRRVAVAPTFDPAPPLHWLAWPACVALLPSRSSPSFPVSRPTLPRKGKAHHRQAQNQQARARQTPRRPARPEAIRVTPVAARRQPRRSKAPRVPRTPTTVAAPIRLERNRCPARRQCLRTA